MATIGKLEVARFSTIPEAELAVAFLQRHGIDADMPDRIMAGTNPDLLIAIGNLRVIAPEAQIVEARRLIAEMREGRFADEIEDYGQNETGWADGRIGDLEEHEVRGAMGGVKKADVWLILAFLLLPLVGCVFGLLT